MRNMILILTMAVAIACQEKPSNEGTAALADPTELKVEQIDLTTVKFTWSDNAHGEQGYRIFLRGKDSGTTVQPLETIAAESTEFLFENLTTGDEYDFGVQAIAEDMRYHSKTVYLNNYKVLDREGLGNLEGTVKVTAPSEVVAVQASNTSVTLTWKDNASDEKGYNLYMREAAAVSFGEPVATVAADTVTYDFKGLSVGAEYIFGVQATGASIMNDSQISSSASIKLRDIEAEAEAEREAQRRTPKVTTVKTSYAYVAVSYKVEKLNGSNPEHGVCFSTSGAPTVNDIKALGPQMAANQEILQVVPNAYLEADKEYQMSVFVKYDSKYYYSEPQTVKLETQPELPSFVWEKQTYAEAEGVEIYKTTSQLNERNFNAWYAIADPTKVDFRVLYPETVGSKKTVAAQAEAAGDCLTLINGAIFGNYNIGVIITEGKMTQQWQGEIEGCYWGTNSQLYQVTRPIIGVDKDGKAGAYWVGVPQQGTFYYYDRPQANVVGQAKYGKVTATSPVEASAWEPYFAISCGPMVLYDGKVCADNSMVDDTHYYTNFECWDESGVYSAHPDRTAVGITADGKIVLFICDGRIDASQGAYMKELGPIMKSLGCVHAMNLDGGGSTGMWVKGSGMINYKDSSWRVIKSTLGFFTKK